MHPLQNKSMTLTKEALLKKKKKKKKSKLVVSRPKASVAE
jgi:predicted GIY-YIG superfamily endonuclease